LPKFLRGTLWEERKKDENKDDEEIFKMLYGLMPKAS
tara:strand:+ start:1655 stop:1765 length:111 start_codon:yes stop_codon:yes gene_type:complete